jgi:hypothetical protein
MELRTSHTSEKLLLDKLSKVLIRVAKDLE